MTSADLSSVRTLLQRRRREILGAARRAATAIDQLREAERDPEPTEASQNEQLQYDLSRLGEAEQREIARIDAALARVEAGEYGLCRDCGEPIGARRLAAMPDVVACAECATGREEAEEAARERLGRPRFMMPE